MVSSDNVSVRSVTLTIDGNAYATSSTAPYSFVVNTLPLANWRHTLLATAVDDAGNIGYSQIMVTVNNASDTQAPSVTILSPSNGATVGSTLSLSASASDNLSVARVELWSNGAKLLTDTAAPYAFSVNTRKWSRGTYALECRAYDAAGNMGRSPLVNTTK